MQDMCPLSFENTLQGIIKYIKMFAILYVFAGVVEKQKTMQWCVFMHKSSNGFCRFPNVLFNRRQLET